MPVRIVAPDSDLQEKKSLLKFLSYIISYLCIKEYTHMLTHAYNNN